MNTYRLVNKNQRVLRHPLNNIYIDEYYSFFHIDLNNGIPLFKVEPT